MKDINGIPCYRATVDGDETGMVVVSLVDAPAVEVDFLAFDKQQPLQFKIQNEEERMVLGVVMRPNYPMYRRDESGFEYYIEYAPETIHKMAEKFFATMNVNNVDTDHNFELVDGVILTQAFFKNVEKGINPIGFEDMPDDTLFFQYHILNDEIWEGVKDGTWKGFSLAGTFGVVPIEMKINKKSDKKMSKLNKVREMLQSILAQFERISTDNGLLSFDGDELEVGMSVNVVDEEGNETVAPDGEYKTDEDVVYVVKEGKVDEIREPDGTQEDETTGDDVQPENEVPEENTEDVPEENEEPAEEPEPEADPRDERIANLEAEVARLEEELGAANAENEQLRERIAELENKPAADAPTDEFEKVTKIEKTGNKNIDNLTRILNA